MRWVVSSLTGRKQFTKVCVQKSIMRIITAPSCRVIVSDLHFIIFVNDMRYIGLTMGNIRIVGDTRVICDRDIYKI